MKFRKGTIATAVQKESGRPRRAEPGSGPRIRCSGAEDEADPGDRGSVTAEFAVLTPVVVLLLGVLLAASTAGMAQLQCIDAARAGARAAARHDDPKGIALAAGPKGASIRVTGAGDLVTVRVSAEVELPLPWHPQIGVASESTAQAEKETGR